MKMVLELAGRTLTMSVDADLEFRALMAAELIHQVGLKRWVLFELGRASVMCLLIEFRMFAAVVCWVDQLTIYCLFVRTSVTESLPCPAVQMTRNVLRYLHVETSTVKALA